MKTKQLRKCLIAFLMALVLMVAGDAVPCQHIGGVQTVQAKTTVKLSKKKATLYVGDTVTLKLKGAKTGKIKWSSSKPDTAKVSSKGKVTALKEGSVTITAKYKKKSYRCKIEVKVITPRDYFYDAARWADDAGITTEFGPNSACSRGQVVTFLWRANGSPTPLSKKNPFSDVKSSDYFYKAVLWAVENGIISDMSSAKFSPKKGCTNGETLSFLWRSMGKPRVSAAGTVAEGYANTAFYKKAVAWADSSGLLILNGKGFDPRTTSSQADVMTWLYLALDGDVRTPAEALADMTGWGVNLAGLYIVNPETGLLGGTTGYFTERPTTEPFGLALNYWDGGFEWIAYHEPHEKSFTASAAMPDYDSSRPRVDWVDSLFFAEFFTDTPNKKIEVTLKDTKIVLADGSSVPLPVMDGKYSAVTGDEADLNGWYRADLEFDHSKLPEPSGKFNGARVETTLVSDTSFASPEDKADYCFALGQKSYDPKKAADIFLDEGINVVRLPVTWTPFVDNETFEIDEIWLERVAEEVDYILQNNAYCILDLHNDYLGKSFVGDHWDYRWMDAKYKDYVDRRFVAIWKQIAEYFKDYPRKLMFEVANEPMMAIDWYEDVEDIYYDTQRARVNEMNELFVKTVRATGGKNSDRILNIVSAEGSSANTLKYVTPPKDDYLIMQLHAYFQIEAKEPGFDSKAETDKFFAEIDEFVKRTGVPVIIGETGVTHLQPETTFLSEINYFFRQARQRGIPALWWEDYFARNDDNLENILWLYDKDADEWGRPKILQAIKDAVED